MAKKTSKRNSNVSFQLQFQSIFTRSSDSLLKEYDFASNHTEDKSLFEAILDDQRYFGEPSVQKQKLSAKGKKKMDGVQKAAPYQQETQQDARKSKRCIKSALLVLEDREDPAPSEEFFSQTLNKKQQSELLVNAELSEEDEIVKAPQIDCQTHRMKEMLPRKSKRKTIYKQVRQTRGRNSSLLQAEELFSNAPVEKPGSYTNDGFDEYLNL